MVRRYASDVMVLLVLYKGQLMSVIILMTVVTLLVERTSSKDTGSR